MSLVIITTNIARSVVCTLLILTIFTSAIFFVKGIETDVLSVLNNIENHPSKGDHYLVYFTSVIGIFSVVATYYSLATRCEIRNMVSRPFSMFGTAAATASASAPSIAPTPGATATAAMAASPKVAKRLEIMREAEASLMEFAHRFSYFAPPATAASAKLTLFDTPIPRRAMTSLKPGCTWTLSGKQEPEYLTMHGVQVHSSASKNTAQDTSVTPSPPPLVLLHGYANGALYYYRNLVGLSQHFTQGVYSLDLMGWGLSSRPHFTLVDKSVEAAESFFVDSLEAWRQHHKIDKMILAGHSMGGYISVAYCERYPQHVERLILLSPVGIPDPEQEAANRKARGMAPAKNVSLSWRLMRTFFTSLWEWEITPGSMLRTISEERGKNMVLSYVENRLPAIDRRDEKHALGNYLYTNALLPPSGEFCLNRILKPMAMARKPAVHRVPLLKVPQITFVYGQHDWMDIQGGLDVQKACEMKRQQLQRQNEDSNISPDILLSSPKGGMPPNVEVHIVKQAGHLLMLENWCEFNSSVVLAGLGHEYFRKNVISRSFLYNDVATVPIPEIVTHKDTERLLAERNFGSVRPSSSNVPSSSSLPPNVAEVGTQSRSGSSSDSSTN